MKKKVYFKDIVALYLFYCYIGKKNVVIPYNQLIDYEKIIKKNLEGIAEIERKPIIENNLFFSLVSKKDRHLYVVIKPDANAIEDMYKHLSSLPIELFIASQMKNALDFVGIKLFDSNNSLENREFTTNCTRKKQLISEQPK